MGSLGPLTFASPWLLLALLALPAIFWLLRVTPPGPRRVPFPALRLLAGLPRTRDEPARSPLWLLLLRALIGLLVILGLAGPVLRASGPGVLKLPLLLVIDDGWASAEGWAGRKRSLLALAESAGRENIPVALLLTAPRTETPPPERLSAADARARLVALDPVPWPVDRDAAARRLDQAALSGASRVIWLTDGLDAPGTAALETAMARRGAVTVTRPAHAPEPLVLGTPRFEAGALGLSLRRADAGAVLNGTLTARAADGRKIGGAPFSFAQGKRDAVGRFTLPAALLNDIARIEIDGHRSAGAVALLDESHRKRNVGLVAGAPNEENQPLLSDLFYLDRALQPFAQVTRGTIESLATPDRSILMLADVGRILGTDRERLVRWVEAGGTLVRFAGPRLAVQTDDLVPVPLRNGGRNLGGALSWDSPEPLGAFDEDGPFAGLSPSPDIHVKRQVLAEPVPDLARHSWARLADGTPLVTATARGAGRIVLVHVTANTDWSDLPLSGVYVEMLRRLVTLAGAPQGGRAPTLSGAEVLPPLRLLDGFGALGPPAPGAEPVKTDEIAKVSPGPQHPPGLYGHDEATLAFNLGRADLALDPLRRTPMVADTALGDAQARDLKPILLCLAALLLLADGLAGLILGGGLGNLRRLSRHRQRRHAAGATLALLACLTGVHPTPAEAGPKPSDAAAIEAVHSFRLAYVRTGDEKADAMSRAGLEGLSRTLAERTAVEPDKPFAIDLDTDELAFFPLLYWQVPATQAPLSDAAIARLDRFMKTGGTLLIDTADADRNFGQGTAGPGETRLRTLLAHLDLPPLAPVGPEHVLTKSFYLLQEFPGRYADGRVWIEASRGGADHDGVAALIVGANDWAAAWARDANGQPLVPVTPGGERQRERALRFGINLVMYSLTGNYKADQVHVPALLERLGQ